MRAPSSTALATAPELWPVPQTPDDLHGFADAVRALLDPLVGTTVDLGGGYGVTLGHYPRPEAEYALQITPSIKGVHAWTTRWNDWGVGDPRLLDWGTGRTGAPARRWAQMFGERRAEFQPAVVVVEAWQRSSGRNPAERRLQALLRLDQATRGYALDGWQANGEPMRMNHGEWTRAELTRALRQLAISGLPDDAWRVACQLFHTLNGSPDELVAVALAAMSAPARP